MYSEESCSLKEFQDLISRKTNPAQASHAASIEQNIPIYDSSRLRLNLSDTAFKVEIIEELGSVLLEGPGVFVLKNAFVDIAPIDHATEIFTEIIQDERGKMRGEDHFAKTGANDRLWNALEKLCLKAPSVFAEYYANDMIALAANSWLGPGYQVTSQINVVRPGGEAQQPHCDYHLGFQTSERAGQYPEHVHQLSSLLTLQGAIAHSDMPVESGPTKILPFSQLFKGGYLAWHREDFKACFEEHYAQLPLQKGDGIFFNPALFHAAGENKTPDVLRMANLLQISSPFGRAMESVDRINMVARILPVLQRNFASGDMDIGQISNIIASCAEGYPFPTNLDTNPPVGGMAPKSQQDLMLELLEK